MTELEKRITVEGGSVGDKHQIDVRGSKPQALTSKKRLPRKFVMRTNKEYILNMWLQHATPTSTVDGKLYDWLQKRRNQDCQDHMKGKRSDDFVKVTFEMVRHN